MISLGLIGFGYWGPNLLRNFSAQPNCRMCMVADERPERLDRAKSQLPGIQTTSSAHQLINDPSIDAVIIATPVFSHYPLARHALEQGKHVLVEKPMTSAVSEAEHLVDLAARSSRVLMVDHTFLYTSAVRLIRNHLASGELGKPLYFDSTRINLGLFQSDVNVLWDLAPHDLSILQYLVPEAPRSISAVGVSHTANRLENVAYMTVKYESGFIAHLNCSWTSPVKVRQTLLGGDRKMVVYNDLEPTEKVRIYDTSYVHTTDEDRRRILVDYRVGDIFIPKLANTEALALVAKDFLEAISEARQPVASAELGLSVVRLLEAADGSLRLGGTPVVL
jgi:predicted dehydrogenase